MTPPADLAALRALVEAVVVRKMNLPVSGSIWNCRVCDYTVIKAPGKALHHLGCPVPAAREALERVERMIDFEGAYQTMGRKLEDEQTRQIALRGRIARTEGLLMSLLACTHGDEAVCGCRTAAQQTVRDVAYWRKRAENAEARIVREGRDE